MSRLSAFERDCQAAEALATLGYAEQSSVLWRAAFAGVGSLDATMTEAVDALLADAPLGQGARAWREWQERARELAANCARQLREPPHSARWPRVVGASLFALALLVFLSRLNSPTLMASGEYGPDFAASMLDDGDLTTEWLLPDGWLGHVDFALPRRRAVHEVVITNGHNREYLDRGTRRVRVVLYDDDLEIDSAEVTFSNIDAEPQQQTAKLAGKRGTRVRVYAMEFLGSGAALAEVQIH